MRFTKMHGIGNDYVYVNCFEQQVADPVRTAIAVSDRHTGIGSDGLILILPSEVADVRMRMFNADGSEGEMCGNGIRCVAKFAFDHGLSKSNPMRIETGRGVLSLKLEVGVDEKVSLVTVDMGAPITDDEGLEKVPVDESLVHRDCGNHDFIIPDSAGKRLVNATFVSMGNPHAVIFVNDLDAVDVLRLGPVLENHAAFPRRMNIHWVEVISRREVRMRTWERGSGITQACGTGACAVAVSAQMTGRIDVPALVHLPGGDLTIDWKDDDDHVYMTGPATEVFSGKWRD